MHAAPGVRSLRRLSLLLLAVAAVAGCGKTTIDQKKAEDFVRSWFNPAARSATCPSGVEAKKGATFTCTAVGVDGRRFRVTAHIVDSGGRIQISSGDVVPET
jgi:uncharacterized protein DUF4333